MFGRDLALRGEIAAPFPLRDMHEIAWDGVALWVTCSHEDMVAVREGDTWRRWYPLGRPLLPPGDRHHFNSFAIDERRVGVLAHNWGASRLFLFDRSNLSLREEVPLGFDAHNAWREGDAWRACSSREGLVVGSDGFTLTTGGFPRGIARANGARLVGISQLAERGERDFTTGVVQVYSDDWQLRREIPLPGEGLVLDIVPYDGVRA